MCSVTKFFFFCPKGAQLFGQENEAAYRAAEREFGNPAAAGPPAGRGKRLRLFSATLTRTGRRHCSPVLAAADRFAGADGGAPRVAVPKVAAAGEPIGTGTIVG